MMGTLVLTMRVQHVNTGDAGDIGDIGDIGGSAQVVVNDPV